MEKRCRLVSKMGFVSKLFSLIRLHTKKKLIWLEDLCKHDERKKSVINDTIWQNRQKFMFIITNFLLSHTTSHKYNPTNKTLLNIRPSWITFPSQSPDHHYQVHRLRTTSPPNLHKVRTIHGVAHRHRILSGMRIKTSH